LKLRSHLTLIVFGTLLPVLVLTVVLIVLYHTQMRRVTEVSLEDNARALASGVDRELDASIGALQVLAVSDALRVGNPREFDRVARTVLAGQRRWTNLVLYDLTGQQLVSLLVPFGTPLQATGDVSVAQPVVQQWLQKGLSLPDWAKQRYGEHWSTCFTFADLTQASGAPVPLAADT